MSGELAPSPEDPGPGEWPPQATRAAATYRSTGRRPGSMRAVPHSGPGRPDLLPSIRPMTMLPAVSSRGARIARLCADGDQLRHAPDAAP